MGAARSTIAIADFGEGATLLDLGVDHAPDRAARTHAAAATLRACFPGVDVVVGAGTILLEGAPRHAIEALIAQGELDQTVPLPHASEHAIPAIYDGPDLEACAAALALSPAALITIHADTLYTAELLGFVPGFAYLGPLDPRLIVARRPSPRPAVAAGSVGIASNFTGIYPFASPGGWNLIARTHAAPLFDPSRDPPSLIMPGDRVRFVPTMDTPPERAPRPASTRAAPITRGLVIAKAQGCVTVQDRGRRGQLGRGLPPSGALAPHLLSAANAAVGNDEGAAGLEIMLGALEVEARGPLTVSIDGDDPQTLGSGERLRVPSSRHAVRYLAVQGGLDVPTMLGARATLPVAKIGGLAGRALHRGDVIPLGNMVGVPRAVSPRAPPSAQPLAIDPGPHVSRFPERALTTLLTTTFRVSRLGDRVGVRLECTKIDRGQYDLALPVPMRRGAIQVTRDGTPIVLGPDHPITGGYPVLAVLRADAQETFALLRPDAEIRFRLA